MTQDASLIWLLLTAGVGSTIGWMYARAWTSGSRAVFHTRVPESQPDPAQGAISSLAVAFMVMLVALDAVAIGALAWAVLSVSGPESIKGAAVPLACLAAASVIVALALGPVLEAVFERGRARIELELAEGCGEPNAVGATTESTRRAA